MVKALLPIMEIYPKMLGTFGVTWDFFRQKVLGKILAVLKPILETLIESWRFFWSRSLAKILDNIRSFEEI